MKPPASEDTPATASDFADFLVHFHDQCAHSIHDPSFLFFNYGLADPDNDAYGWVRPEDRAYRYYLNLVRRMLEHVDLREKRVLDVSSGRGGNCYYLLHYSEARYICGIDRCEAYVRFCHDTFSDRRIGLICADAERFPFRNESFDVVLNVQSSHCYADFPMFLQEAHRVLRPGGTLAYSDAWDIDKFPLDWNGRRRQLSESGMDIVQQDEISANVSAAMQQDDGFASVFLKAASHLDKELFLSVSAGLQEIQSSLAAHRATYWFYRLVKPPAVPGRPAISP